MADTTFVQHETVIQADWLNDVNDFTYTEWRKWVVPTDPQFGGIVSGSWHTAINAAGTFAAANGCGVRFLPQTGGYPTTGACTIPAGVPVDMSGTYITYSGTRPVVALTIGTLGTVNGGLVARGLDVRAAGSLQWPGTLALGNDIGIRLADPHKSTIEIRNAEGFTVGYELYGSAAPGCAYNHVFVGNCYNCKYGEVLKTYSASGFVNENLFIGGEHACSSAANALGDAYGTALTWDKSTSYRGQNNNVWLHPSYELGDPGSGSRIPVLFDGAGGYNRWIHARHESNRGVFAYCDGGGASNVIHNVFEIGFAGAGSVVEGITETGGAFANIYQPTKQGARASNVWYSGEIASFLSGQAANTPYISGPFHFAQNSAAIAKSLANGNLDYGIENNIEYFRANGSTVGVGVFFEISKTKTFQITENVITGFPGRIGFQCFDSTGAILTSAGGGHPYVRASTGLTYSASYGGAYTNGSDSFSSDTFTFGSDVVYVRLFFVGGTNPLKLISFSIAAIGVAPSSPISVFSNILDDGTQKLSSAKPDTAGEAGRYARGNAVWNSGAAAAATAGWVCSSGGRLAKAWAISTAYVVGQVRKNGGNVYVCKVAGTSAGAGGPSGTGTGIADNTVTWDYVAPVAAFATMANLA